MGKERSLDEVRRALQQAMAADAPNVLCQTASHESGRQVAIVRCWQTKSRTIAGTAPPHPTTLFSVGQEGALVVEGVVPSDDPFFLRIAEFATLALSCRRTSRALELLRRVRRRTNATSLGDPFHRLRHDLKSPMTVARGYADMLRRGFGGPLTPAMARYVERIVRALEQQQRIAEKLLSRMDACAPSPQTNEREATQEQGDQRTA